MALLLAFDLVFPFAILKTAGTKRIAQSNRFSWVLSPQLMTTPSNGQPFCSDLGVQQTLQCWQPRCQCEGQFRSGCIDAVHGVVVGRLR